MSHIFISYSREDTDFARHLRALLQKEGFRVWMDEQRLHPGTDWWDEIEFNIVSCRAFVVVMSPNSAKSKWVKREILVAEDNLRPIFPILLAGKVFGRLADLHAEDMTGGITAQLSQRLLDSLQAVVGNPANKDFAIRLVQGNVINVPADVLVLKYMQSFLGASMAVLNALQKKNIEIDKTALSTHGTYQLVASLGALHASHVLYVSTPYLRQFKYADLTAFIRQAMHILKTEMPHVRHIAMTIHGVKFGMDEREAFITQLKALIDQFASGDVPPNLEQVSIIETQADRVSRLIDIADEFMTQHGLTMRSPDDGTGTYYLSTSKATSEMPAVAISDAKPYIVALMPPDDSYDDSFYYGIQRPVHAYGLLCERESADLELQTADDILSLCQRLADAKGVIIHLDNSPLTTDFALQIGIVWGANRPTLFICQNEPITHPLLPMDGVLTYKKISDLEVMIADYLKQLLL